MRRFYSLVHQRGEYTAFCAWWLGTVFIMWVCICVCVCVCVCEGREGTALFKPRLAHEQSFCTEDLPILQRVMLQGRTVGDSCSLRSCEPKSLFGGRPACLQLCLLRQWESSQTSLSLSSLHWKGTAPKAPFYHASGKKIKEIMERETVQYNWGWILNQFPSLDTWQLNRK